MKTKNSLFLILMVLFLAGMIFVGVVGVKADVCADCTACLDGPPDNSCDTICNACADAPVGSGTSACNADTDPICCSGNGGYWYNNTCNVDAQVGSGTATCPSGLQDDTGFCYSNLTDYCADVNDPAQCGGTLKGTTCTTDAECDPLVCNLDGTCGQSIFGSVVNTVTDLANSISINGVKIGMKNGNLTVGASISIGGQNVPAGSYVSEGSVYNGLTGAIIPGLTPTAFESALGVDASGVPVFSGSTAAVAFTCGEGFVPSGGVCFPVIPGMSEAPIYVILSNIFSWMMGLFVTLAVIAFVISGIQYLMASTNEELVETAKHNATNAAIGIIVGLSGYIIVKAIAAALSGKSILF